MEGQTPIADIRSVQSFYALFEKYLDHMPEKFEQNHMVQVHKILNFWQKMFHHVWQSIDTIFGRHFLWLKQLLDAKLLI